MEPLASRSIRPWLAVRSSSSRSTCRAPVRFGTAIQIFLEPPNWDELVRRLIGRGTETPEQQAERLETAKWELEAKSDFDAVVVNGEIEEPVDLWVELTGL